MLFTFSKNKLKTFKHFLIKFQLINRIWANYFWLFITTHFCKTKTGLYTCSHFQTANPFLEVYTLSSNSLLPLTTVAPVCLFVCNRGDTLHYWMWTDYGTLLHSSMSPTNNTTQYHVGHSIKGDWPSPYIVVPNS